MTHSGLRMSHIEQYICKVCVCTVQYVQSRAWVCVYSLISSRLLFVHLLLLDLLHYKLLYLAGDGGGEAVHELQVAGDLEVGQLQR